MRQENGLCLEIMPQFRFGRIIFYIFHTSKNCNQANCYYGNFGHKKTGSSYCVRLR